MSAGKGDKNRVRNFKRYQNNYDDIFKKYTTTEFFYVWPDGREEVRYRRSYNSEEALTMIEETYDLKSYGYRHI
jgi:hypothetical protein